MRILLINNTHTIKGGADRVYFNTGKLLEDNHHDVQYFSTFDQIDVESDYSKYFVKISNKRNADFATKVSGVKDYIYNKEAYSNLFKLIEDFKPDIAHIHLFCGGLSTSILKALKINKVPIIQTVHDYRLLCPANALLDSKNQICEKCKNKSYYQCSFKKCVDGNFFYSTMVTLEAYYRKYVVNPLDFIDHFVFVSHFSQLKHIEFDSRYKAKSSHLYNFTAIPDEYPSVIKGKYLLYFGRLSREKGLTSLINAATETKNLLKIVGSGPLYKEILELASENRFVEVLGHQSGNMLTDLIKNSSFVIVPSEWYENNPMTVLEAFAQGKPVIGARIGGIPEIVKDSKTGFLFDSRNIIDLKETILKAQQLSESNYLEMSANSRRFAQSYFSSDVHYHKLMGIYSKYVL
jgi:glycosyltransferase involved in cell wall biosynthesis